MGYDSRRWIWWPLVAVTGSLPIGWFVATAALDLPAGRASFAKKSWSRGEYDELERTALFAEFAIPFPDPEDAA